MASGGLLPREPARLGASAAISAAERFLYSEDFI